MCLPFWDSLTGSQQQMLRLNTIVRSYRAGDDVIFSMPEKNGLFLVLSGGVRLFIANGHRPRDHAHVDRQRRLLRAQYARQCSAW